ncbi:hypothetical protein EYC80_004015 [Monilinia laxa]|uniref:Uncharacterized protein n=1 Tax=Monilinia laxa TaxID=61186 RepID=A0A5N6KLF8_MONLA|nr:hypothetical protein EYC80_004015 [Monilinia laxa]
MYFVEVGLGFWEIWEFVEYLHQSYYLISLKNQRPSNLAYPMRPGFLKFSVTVLLCSVKTIRFTPRAKP